MAPKMKIGLWLQHMCEQIKTVVTNHLRKMFRSHTL